jgi:hypothetical protein
MAGQTINNAKEPMKKYLPLFCCILSLIIADAFAQSTESQEACKQATVPLVSQIPGWCSQAKAAAMMDLIFKVQPEICVEIGVFAGASILPTATALKYLGKGVVYAIDPWDNYECIRFFPADSPHTAYWSKIDFNYIFNYFLNLIKLHGLRKQCFILRSTSEDAIKLINAIDILHIDGMHSDESALSDITLYLPKVKVGGYIWFDGWNAAPNAFEYIKKNCYVRKVIDQGSCVLLEKISEDTQ